MPKINPSAGYWLPELSSPLRLPLFMTPVPAGDPSSGDDHVERYLDISRHLIRNPVATFLVRVTGDSMIGAGIRSGDILVVDRSIEPADGKIVIAVVEGRLTVKRLRIEGEKAVLVPENPDYAEVEIGDGSDVVIWGVVTGVVRSL